MQHKISWNIRRFRKMNKIIMTRLKTSRRTKTWETVSEFALSRHFRSVTVTMMILFFYFYSSSISSSQMSSMIQNARMNNCGDLLLCFKKWILTSHLVFNKYSPSQNSHMGSYKTGTVPCGCCMVPSDWPTKTESSTERGEKEYKHVLEKGSIILMIMITKSKKLKHWKW
jgi:hypothetical protein